MWGDGSVGKVMAAQAKESKWGYPEPTATCVYNVRADEVKTRKSLGLAGLV